MRKFPKSMSAPTTGLPTLIVQSLQWSSLHYLARALALLCWASLRKQGPTCTLDITLTLCVSEGIGEGVGVCEYVDVRSSGFLFKCSWDQFHWPGGWELRRGGGEEGRECLETRKLMRTETSYQEAKWKFAGGANLIYGWRILCCVSLLGLLSH